MVRFSDRLENLINKQGLTLKDLAEHLDITEATLSRYKNGKREPKMHIVKKIADYFNVSVDYLMGNTDVRSPINQILNYKTDNKDLQEVINILEKGDIIEKLDIVMRQDGEMSDEEIETILNLINTLLRR